MSMIPERDHATTAFEDNIATFNHAMPKINDALVYRAMIAEHAGATNLWLSILKKRAMS